MDGEIDSITDKFSKLSVYNTEKIILLQKNIRGYLLRLKQMPLIMYVIKRHLIKERLKLTLKNEDGRVNSSTDETIIVDSLIEKFGDRIRKPRIRMWYDISVYDYRYGWLPVNIKTTTMDSADNTGNLTMCVYSYTDYPIDLDKSYQNGEMSTILLERLKQKKYNHNYKKDYYFLVINKNNTTNIIVNSLRGLCTITPNINNLPFQVRWSNNRIFRYSPIESRVKLFLECMQKIKPGWKEIFVSEIKKVQMN